MTEPAAGYSLVHPVYLDVPMMVSFLAHVEGGFAVDEEQTSTHKGARDRLLKGRAGLRLRLAPMVGGEAVGEASTQRRDEDYLESRTTRHHTMASLFNLLYDYLVEDEQVIPLSDPSQLDKMRSGQLVEVAGEYLGNPLEETLAVLGSFLPYLLAQQEAKKQSSTPAKGQQRRSGNPAKRQNVTDPQAVAAAAIQEAMQQQMDEASELGVRAMIQMSEDIKGVPVHDLLFRTAGNLDAVLTVDSEYYSAATHEYLRAGEFRVVGKVTRVITGDRKINLTRRTVLGAAQPEVAQELIGGMRNESFALDVPDPIVSAPAVQILPMAIFL